MQSYITLTVRCLLSGQYPRNLRVGENITIHSRKFDGRISKTWRAELVEWREALVILRGVFNTEVDHRKLGHIRRGTISYEFFWLDRWYNIFRFHEPEGALRSYYCNVTTPPVLSGITLEYIDLDIDVLADPQLNYEILDMDEFEQRTAELGYTENTVDGALKSLAELVDLIESRSFPFSDNVGIEQFGSYP